MLGKLLKAPMTSTMWVFRSIHDAVEGELDRERESIRARLNELYLELEAGDLDEDAFDELEEELLDRLDEIDEIMGGGQ
jgi:hypothetical protein